MSVLSNVDIVHEMSLGNLGIDPYDPALVQPNSVDLLLSNHFQVIAVDKFVKQQGGVDSNGWLPWLDPFDLPGDLYQDQYIGPNSCFVLQPHSFALGSTIEVVRLAPSLCARVEGKSSLARLGIVVHATAGFVDAGYEGTITLELSNLSPLPIMLRPRMPIAQLCIQNLKSPTSMPYGQKGDARYFQSRGTVGSRFDQGR